MWLLLLFTLLIVYYFYVIKGSRVTQDKLRLLLKMDSSDPIINYVDVARKRYMIHFRVMNLFSRKEQKEQGRQNYEAMFSTYHVYFHSLYGEFDEAERILHAVEWDKVSEQFVFNKYLASAVTGYLHNNPESALQDATLLAKKVRDFFGVTSASYNPSVMKKYYNFYDSYVYIGNLLLGDYEEINIQNLRANFDAYKSSDIITSLLAAKSLKKYYQDNSMEEQENEMSSYILENTSPKIHI